LSLNFPIVGLAPDLASALRTLAKRPDHAELLRYQPHAGAQRHRAAGAAWARRYGVTAAPEQVLVCAGAQHAMLTIFSALAKPGDRVLTEALTYPGMKALASLLHLSLEAVAMDGEGLRPRRARGAAPRARAPSSCTACRRSTTRPARCSDARRRAIADLARAHDVAIIEDDVHRFLVFPTRHHRSPSSAPERTYRIAGTSKAIAGGLRAAFVTAPRDAVAHVERSIWATTWMRGTRHGGDRHDLDRGRHGGPDRRRATCGGGGAPGDRTRHARRPRSRQSPVRPALLARAPDPWRGESFARATLRRGVAASRRLEIFTWSGAGRGPRGPARARRRTRPRRARARARHRPRHAGGRRRGGPSIV
jgi:hypothetical protein